MAKKFQNLAEKMSPQAQARAKLRTKAMLAEMPLVELRHARTMSQENIAVLLKVKQSSVSKLEKRTDMYISSLRSYIEAMGGELDIVARFPEGEVRINQFEELD